MIRFQTPHCVLFLVMVVSVAAFAQPTQASPKSEAEYLVPPQGGAYEVPMHAGAVCILSFPEKMASKALASSPDFEIKSWGDDGVAIRAIHDKVTSATLALATSSRALSGRPSHR